ncbi:hypothetical protein F2Q69_00063953 [Brassica cretica]|uniref:Uncharacterized protein n=1 Tax=Brassica cretica TaxID=69181 RepID=A0A8S9RA65_BRACR|nr:hypothetical protein F2Q69_00063953 [Brassica cretica]
MDQASVSSNLRGTHGKIKVKANVLECFVKQQMVSSEAWRSRGEAESGRTCGAVFFSGEFLRKESRECHQVSRFSVVSSDGVKGSAYGYKM